MKKSELKELVREIVGGYEPDGAGNLVRHNDRFDSVKLSAILKDLIDRDNQGEQEGEDTIYEGEEGTMDLQQLIDYIKELSPEVQLWVPTLYPGGFGKDQQTRKTVDQAVEALTGVLGSPDHNETQFELYQDSPTFKKFSVVQSPEELERRTAMVRSMGPLD